MNTSTIRSSGQKLAAFLLLGCLMILQTAQAEPLPEPAKTVIDKYEKIGQALIKENLQQVPDNAMALAKAIRDNPGKGLPLSMAEQADKLAKATDLKSARAAYKPLSESLIAYLAKNDVKSSGLKEVYCPMAEASWIQKAQAIQNPYMGKSMPSCGEVKRKF